ncbi:hypothetical protein LCGC14_2901480 [marine sediment metagenome]|uniref:Uncharacterized protein n=1 Tax=marine sediment metagenome TaxID=412755 RepID=A0A0F9AKE7_9ZZZZ
MVLIVSQSWYPASQAEKAGKAYLDALKKYPEDRSLGKPILRAAVKMTKKGIHTIAISSVKEGKVNEAMDQAINITVINAKAIEGLKTTIDIYYDLAEAMPFVGLKAPE